MTGQGSSAYESIAASKTRLNSINITKVIKTEDGNRVRGLVYRAKDGSAIRTNVTYSLDGSQIIKGQYLEENFESGTKTWKETEWAVTGVHPTDPRLNLVEYKPVTPRLPQITFAILFTFLLASCGSLNAPFRFRAEMYVSVIKECGISCNRQMCDISIDNSLVAVKCPTITTTIDRFKNVRYGYAEGKDLQNKPFTVMAGKMKKEPYMLVIKSDSVCYIFGYQCYQL